MSDRLGSHSSIMGGALLAACGAFTVSAGFVVAGSVALLCGAAITASALPLTVSSGDVASLARINVARDAGAALGVLVGIALFRTAGPSLLYLTGGVLLIASCVDFESRRLALTNC